MNGQKSLLYPLITVIKEKKKTIPIAWENEPIISFHLEIELDIIKVNGMLFVPSRGSYMIIITTDVGRSRLVYTERTSHY